MARCFREEKLRVALPTINRDTHLPLIYTLSNITINSFFSFSSTTVGVDLMPVKAVDGDLPLPLPVAWDSRREAHSWRPQLSPIVLARTGETICPPSVQYASAEGSSCRSPTRIVSAERWLPSYGIHCQARRAKGIWAFSTFPSIRAISKGKILECSFSLNRIAPRSKRAEA